MQNFRATLNDLASLLASMGARDAVDILLVAVFFFFILGLMRSSRNQVALRGLLIVLTATLGLYLVTLVADLRAMSWLFERMAAIFILVYLIVFQAEFKKALADYGRLPIFRGIFRTEAAALEEIVRAAARLAEKKVGALIAIERRTSLRPYLDNGTVVDARVSVELLRTIFAMYTPLHDGAVIVRNNRIAGAACILPLTSQPLSKDLGTRHRAAVGVSEETDAVVIVVSEETGTISLCHDGVIERPETPESLRHKLRALLEVSEEDADGGDS